MVATALELICPLGFLAFLEFMGPLWFLGFLGSEAPQGTLESVRFVAFVGFLGPLWFVGFVWYVAFLRKPSSAASSIYHFRVERWAAFLGVLGALWCLGFQGFLRPPGFLEFVWFLGPLGFPWVPCVPWATSVPRGATVFRVPRVHMVCRVRMVLWLPYVRSVRSAPLAIHLRRFRLFTTSALGVGPCSSGSWGV